MALLKRRAAAKDKARGPRPPRDLLAAARRRLHVGYVCVGVNGTAMFYATINAIENFASGEPAWVSLVGVVLNTGVVVLWLRTIKNTKSLLGKWEAISRAEALIDMISFVFADQAGESEPPLSADGEMEGWAAQSTPYLKEMDDVAAGGVADVNEA